MIKESVAAITQRKELIEMVVEYVVEKKEKEDRATKLKELEVKKLQLENEDLGRQEQIRIRDAEIKRNIKKDDEEVKRLNSSDIKAKRYGDTLRGCMEKMPSDPIEILPWFRSVEKIFTNFKIENQL
jgi:hypothetical protein